MKSCCSSTPRDKKCRRKSDKKIFGLPRRFTRKRCLSGKVRGFTMRSSCAPYKGCKATKRRRKHKGGVAPPPRDMPTNLRDFMEQITYRQVIGAETKLVSLFNKFRRGFTQNHLSNLAQEIRDEIRAFNGDTDSLLFMLFLLTSRDELQMEYRSVPPGLRELFISETNNIRNELLEALSRLRYHLPAIRHFMNTEPDFITHELMHQEDRYSDIDNDSDLPTIMDSIGYRDDASQTSDTSTFNEAPVAPEDFVELGEEFTIPLNDMHDDHFIDDGGPLTLEDLQGGKRRIKDKRKRKRTHKRRKHKKVAKSLKKRHYKKHK